MKTGPIRVQILNFKLAISYQWQYNNYDGMKTGPIRGQILSFKLAIVPVTVQQLWRYENWSNSWSNSELQIGSNIPVTVQQLWRYENWSNSWSNSELRIGYHTSDSTTIMTVWKLVQFVVDFWSSNWLSYQLQYNDGDGMNTGPIRGQILNFKFAPIYQLQYNDYDGMKTGPIRGQIRPDFPEVFPERNWSNS
jgi:hypothetical protein